jgi:anthranilate synthase component 2
LIVYNMKNILLIDNYDSFTYNLLHYLGELGAKVNVVRNDKITVEAIRQDKTIDGIVLSPGPCTPNEAGICLELVEELYTHKPIFGVCLGHQTIGQAFGGNVIRAPKPMHGKVSRITHNGKGIFQNIPSPFDVTRYHSLIVERKTLPECLEITAETDDAIIMGLQHKHHPIFGVQFHPESIASEHGHEVLRNFLKLL